MKKSELQALKLFQLKRLASRFNIPGRASMSKAALVDALTGKNMDLAPKKKVPARTKSAVLRPRPAPKPRVAEPKATVRTAAKPRPATTARPAPPAPPARSQRSAPKPQPPFYEPLELADAYHVDRIILLPRDPNWLFAYWEVTRQRFEAGLAQLGVSAVDVRSMLRVHDVSDVPVDPASGLPRLDESRNYVTLEIAPMANNWYIKVEQPGRVYCVEYVLVTPNGRVFSLMTSNPAATPLDHVSDTTDEEWATGGTGRKTVGRARGPAASKWVQKKMYDIRSTTSGGWSSELSSRGVRS